MNRIPSFIIIPTLPTGIVTTELRISRAAVDTDDIPDIDIACPPPPALERWSSEGSTGGCTKCQAPPTLPARRGSEHMKQLQTKCTHHSCLIDDDDDSVEADEQQPMIMKDSIANKRRSRSAPRLPTRKHTTKCLQHIQGQTTTHQCVSLAEDRWH